MDKQYFLDKLARTRKEVFESYNYDLLPSTFLANDKVDIQCYKHGVFSQRPGAHLFGSGCPECGIERVAKGHSLTKSEFIRKAKDKFGDKFDYSKFDCRNGFHESVIACPIHGDFKASPKWHLRSPCGCLKCDNEKYLEKRKRNILRDAIKKHKGKYDYSRMDYRNANDPVEIICPKHGSFWQQMSQHVLAPVGCPKCSREKDRVPFQEFVTRAKEVHGDRYEYHKETYHSGRSKIRITCKKHGDFEQRANSHLNGCRCRQCYVEDSWTLTEAFIEASRRIHGDTYDYSRVKYAGSKKPVEIICKKHGSFWQVPNTHMSNRSGCRFCYESKGEKAIEVALKKHGISFIREYRLFPHKYRSDFYLPEFKIHIEFNGIQHYRPVDTFGGNEAFAKVRENDEIKKVHIRTRGEFLIVISFKSLATNSVEVDLIRELKHVYRYWFVIDGKLMVYKNLIDVCKAFNLSMKTNISEVISEVLKRNPGLQLVF